VHQRPSDRRFAPLALGLSLLAGTTLSLPAWADDSGDIDAPATTSAPAEPATATPDSPATDAKAIEQARARQATLIDDFCHYVIIDRWDLAKATADGLIAENIPAVEFARLVDRGVGERRFARAVTKAQGRADVEKAAAALLKLYETGQLSAARNPEAVAANIKLLVGDGRNRSFARDRLLEAGEYAVPQLFSTLMDASDPLLQAETRRVLVELGRRSVIPLVTALPSLRPQEQIVVSGILGDMPQQTTALPFLYDLAASTPDAGVRSAAEDAIRRISGMLNASLPVADRYNDLADAYYKASPSLVSFPGEDNQLFWSYLPGAGLTMQAVDSRVWPQTMAMRLSELALRRDPSSARAVSNWIAANFSRELNTPEGYVNPAYGADRREAMYYAVAAGSQASQAVLARALDSGDTRLARKALEAIEKTAGGKGLWSGSGADRRPLLEALRYPNRRVQYDAALALAGAQPREVFDGSDQVVRILAGSIRDAGAKYALVVAAGSDAQERQSSIAGLLKDQGYTVLAPAQRLDDARQDIADAPGVDLIVTALPSDSTAELIAQAGSDARLRATPVLALVSAQGFVEQSPRFARDPRVKIARDALQPGDIAEAARQLVESASGGPIAGDEAEAYRARSLSALRDLAVGNNPIMSVADAQAPLIAALETAPAEQRLRIAEVLAHIGSERAQRTVFEAAMAAEGADRVALLGHAAGSAKRFGNLLEQRQVDALVAYTRSATGDEGTAAAALMGALNLSGTNIVPLILGDEKTVSSTTR
jgi:hypothetical protein